MKTLIYRRAAPEAEAISATAERNGIVFYFDPMLGVGDPCVYVDVMTSEEEVQMILAHGDPTTTDG